MITFSTIGTFGNSRLGNQMFQYAATKAVALKAGALLAMPLQKQELSDVFNLDCNYYLLEREQHNLNRLDKYRERAFNYEDRFEQIVDGTDLEGYFQSEKYFLRFEDIIRADFVFKKAMQDAANNFIASIRVGDVPLVAVHVRRGDYLQLQNFHPVCSLTYYAEAMSLFDECRFILFSDDMEWCKLNIKGKNIFYSTLPSAYQDLCAMALCNHQIIANSSFSWWGAWLNNNPVKKVVAPRKWFGVDYNNHNTDDLYGKNWIVI